MTIHKSEDLLRARAKVLKLHGMLAHWDEISETGWIESLIQERPPLREFNGVDREAMRVARQWHYQPGTRDGRPVAGVEAVMRQNPFDLKSSPLVQS